MSGYLIQFGPVVYEKRGGGSFTLVEAMREVYGVGEARIRRTDGTLVVRYAGSSSRVLHVPSGRMLDRRPRIMRRSRRRWLAELAAS